MKKRVNKRGSRYEKDLYKKIYIQLIYIFYLISGYYVLYNFNNTSMKNLVTNLLNLL